MQMPRPNPDVLTRKAELVRRLHALLPSDSVISDPVETKAYECDGLSAYRCPPMAAVLPRSTQEVAAVLKLCHEMNVPVVPRGAGTSLAGGALPTADSLILGVARLNDVLETDYENRVIQSQTRRTNPSVTGPAQAQGCVYVPDPARLLAGETAGNMAMNYGGAHCLI